VGLNVAVKVAKTILTFRRIGSKLTSWLRPTIAGKLMFLILLWFKVVTAKRVNANIITVNALSEAQNARQRANAISAKMATSLVPNVKRKSPRGRKSDFHVEFR
jgi:hypothetical protein